MHLALGHSMATYILGDHGEELCLWLLHNHSLRIHNHIRFHFQNWCNLQSPDKSCKDLDYSSVWHCSNYWIARKRCHCHLDSYKFDYRTEMGNLMVKLYNFHSHLYKYEYTERHCPVPGKIYHFHHTVWTDLTKTCWARSPCTY